MTHIFNLPVELLAMVADELAAPSNVASDDVQQSLRSRLANLRALSNTSHHLHHVVDPVLYKLDLTASSKDSKAMWKGVEKGLVSTVEKSLIAGFRPSWRSRRDVKPFLPEKTSFNCASRVPMRNPSEEKVTRHEWLKIITSYGLTSIEDRPLTMDKIEDYFDMRYPPYGRPNTPRYAVDNELVLDYSTTAMVPRSRKVNVTPVELATALGHLAIVELLVKHPQTSALTRVRPRWGALVLSSLKPDYYKWFSAYPTKGHTSLVHFAIGMGRPEIARFLLGQSMSSRRANSNNLGTGETILHTAAVLGNRELVAELAEQYPQLVTTRDCRNLTPLHYAAANDCFRTIPLLVERGASIDEEMRPGINFLAYALMERDYHAAMRLLDLGADSTALSLPHGQSILHVLYQSIYRAQDAECREHERRSLFRRFITLESSIRDINTADNTGLTPLMAASRDGLASEVEQLLALGANPKTLSPVGDDALLMACRAKEPAGKFWTPMPFDHVVLDKVNALLSEQEDGTTWDMACAAIFSLWHSTGRGGLRSKVFERLVSYLENAGKKLREIAACNLKAKAPPAYKNFPAGTTFGFNLPEDHILALPHNTVPDRTSETLMCSVASEIEDILCLAKGLNQAQDMFRCTYVLAKEPQFSTNSLLFTRGALFWAFLRSGRWKLILELLKMGAPQPVGLELLHIATVLDQVDVVNYLLEKGADANTMSSSGSTPVMLLARFDRGNEKVMRALLQHGGRLLEAPGADGTTTTTPLSLAIKEGSSRFLPTAMAIISELGTKKYSVEALNRHLHLIFKGQFWLERDMSAIKVSLVHLLIPSGADINSKDQNGDTILAQIFRSLLESSPCPGLLRWLTFYGEEQNMVALLNIILLHRGIDYDLPSSDGKSAKDWVDQLVNGPPGHWSPSSQRDIRKAFVAEHFGGAMWQKMGVKRLMREEWWERERSAGRASPKRPRHAGAKRNGNS